MFWKLVTRAAVAGVAAAIAVTTPASAATAPTLTGPASATGFGTITLTGTADPGAAVHLYESAIGFNELRPADDWENGGGTVTATADANGRFTITRFLDTGFYFQVESGGVLSSRITVLMRVRPTFWLRSPSRGVVQAQVEVSPQQGGLPIQVQRASGSSWLTVARGATGNDGAYAATMTGVAGGNGTYRAYVGADPKNGVLANYSAGQTVWVAGTVPAPASAPAPAVGSVQFTRIQYNSPGTDTGSNASLNGEWVQVTNKTSHTVNLRGWIIRDAAAHVYTFPTNVYLGAGKSLAVHTGKGTATTNHRYWGRTSYIWNNTGDTATLRTGAGKTIDSCRWGAGSGVTTC